VVCTKHNLLLEPGQRRRVATGVRLGHSPGLKFRQRQAIFFFCKMSRSALGHTHTTTIQCVSGFFTGVKWRGVMLTTHLDFAPTLRIGGRVPLFPVYPFMVWTRTTL
jgi:hypothetical protein